MKENAKVITKAPLDLDQDIIRHKALKWKIWEKDLINILYSIKFSNYKNDFQQKLDADIAKLKQSKNVFVFADKTSNIYKMSEEQH